MQKVILPRRHVVSAEFAAALVALCRARGLDIKHAWPLADAKRLAAEEARRFEEARADALARHGNIRESTEANRAFVSEVTKLFNEPVEFPVEAHSIVVSDGALTGDVLEQVMEFLKRPA